MSVFLYGKETFTYIDIEYVHLNIYGNIDINAHPCVSDLACYKPI